MSLHMHFMLTCDKSRDRQEDENVRQGTRHDPVC